MLGFTSFFCSFLNLFRICIGLWIVIFIGRRLFFHLVWILAIVLLL